MEGKVTNLLQEENVLTSFVLPELLKGDYETIKKFYKEEKGLLKYQFNLECVYRYKEHSLDEESEKLLSTISKSFIASDTFEALTDGDLHNIFEQYVRRVKIYKRIKMSDLNKEETAWRISR